MAEKILVVDDEREIADLVALYLTNENYTVYKSYTAEEALTHIGTADLDLAILDIMLPGTDGLSICRTIREKHTYPIILLTAKDTETDKITGLTAFFVVLLLLLLARGYIGEFLVDVIMVMLKTSRNRALSLYSNYVRGNLEYILMGAVAVSFLVLSRFLLSRFAKYFSEISDSLDSLVEDKKGEIELSPEMAAMEHKIKAIKHTLDERERDARLAEQRKNDMVMYLAHDIKTPLTSVIGYLNLLDEASDMPAQQRGKYIRITLDKANRLEKLVDEFFEITRYNFQIDAMAKEPINLSHMLAQMVEELHPLLGGKGNCARLRVPEDMMVRGDPDKLARVFHNILKNAVAYSPDNSPIDIEAAYFDDTVSITFTNEGAIPRDKLTSIFDKFYRLDSARSSASGGAGLGLAIAKEIVTVHGGRIYAQSADGRTAFTVELPR